MIPDYDVVWNSQSENSAGSMPVGGYDAGANVWVERDELLMCIDRSGSFDENNQMLKLGRLRFAFSGKPFEGGFSQRLRLETGSVVFRSGRGFEAEVWFHTDSPVARVDVRADEPLELSVTYESWRLAPREIPKDRSAAAFSYLNYPGTVYTWPDEIAPEPDHLTFCHINRDDRLLFDFLVRQQGLEEIRHDLDNPQKGLIFGGLLTGEGLRYDGQASGTYAQVPFAGYRYKSPAKRAHSVSLCFHTAQAEPDRWARDLTALSARQSARTDARDVAMAYWHAFWERSYIHINPESNASDEGFRMARNYSLFRYMLGCNPSGEYPTKFNGGLFTVDPVYAFDESYAGETPDYRRWGGGSFTAQNQRLLYWPMLKCGDFDMMLPQFQYYLRSLPNALRRTRHYWGHGGCSFVEQVENMGLPAGICWGFEASEAAHCVRPKYWEPAELRCPWTRYEYVTQLEFAFMMLEYGAYMMRDICVFMPFIEACVTFFEEHYEMLHEMTARDRWDADGHWVIFPSTALETYKDALNPTDVLAALRRCSQGSAIRRRMRRKRRAMPRCLHACRPSPPGNAKA